MTIIDADGLIMGRLASAVATKLLAGEEVDIINAEKAIISGSKYTTMREYDETLRRGKPEFGPFFPKRPDRILKRTVRGMLPYKRARGKTAMSNLKVYVGVPEELQDKECIRLEEASMERLSSNKYLSLGDLSKKLGAKF
jgi:large subunit ribosomal protein L13